jgi:hypothetical protein
MENIRIIAIPGGDAPLTIRQKWLGIKLPLARCPNTSSVSTDTNDHARQTDGNYYVVDASDALSALNKSSPAAANWWRRHIPPITGNKFLFSKDDCELIDRERIHG